MLNFEKLSYQYCELRLSKFYLFILLPELISIFLICSMLMPKKNRVQIYEYLFKEGVMVAKKDFHLPKHPELETIPNLQVIKAMQVRNLILASVGIVS